MMTWSLLAIGAMLMFQPDASQAAQDEQTVWPRPLQQRAVYTSSQGIVTSSVPHPGVNGEYLRARMRQRLRAEYRLWFDMQGLEDEVREQVLQVLLARHWQIAEARLWLDIAQMEGQFDEEGEGRQWYEQLERFSVSVFAEADRHIGEVHGEDMLASLRAFESSMDTWRLIEAWRQACSAEVREAWTAETMQAVHDVMTSFWQEVPVHEDFWQDHLNEVQSEALAEALKPHLNEAQQAVVAPDLENMRRPRATIWVLRQPGVGHGRQEGRFRPVRGEPEVQAAESEEVEVVE